MAILIQHPVNDIVPTIVRKKQLGAKLMVNISEGYENPPASIELKKTYRMPTKNISQYLP